MNNKNDKKKWILFVSIITSFVTTFIGSALNLSIPQIEENFNVSAQEVNWTITIYMLTCGALAVPFGKIGDIINRKLILCVGLLLFSISSIFSIFSNSLNGLVAYRFIQGVGAAMIFSANIAILLSSTSKDERGKLLGYSTGANYVGLSAGPVVGGFLNNSFGWKSIFIITAAISLVAFCSAVIKVPREEKSNKTKYALFSLDWKGVILYVTSICLIMYGLSSLGSLVYSKYLFFVGIASFIIFFKYEIKKEKPILNVRYYMGNKAHTCSNLAAFFNYGAVFAASYLVSIYLQIVRGYSSTLAGIILVAAPVVQAFFSPIAGKMADKHTPQLISSIGAFLCAISLFALSFVDLESSIIYLICILMLEGLGCAVFSSPNSSAVMSSIAKEDYGVASSVLSTMRSIGHTTSMAVVTLIMDVYVGKIKMNDATTQILMESIQICLYVFTAWCIIGFFMALKRKS